MSSELNISLGQTGQTVIGRVYSAGTQVGTDIIMSENIGQGGYYTGNMPAVAAGYYDVQFFVNGSLRGSGNINWNGTAEVVGSSLTAVQIRSEMDANSTKLANLDATVSSRLAASAYVSPTTPPTAVQIRSEMDANSTKLVNLDASISSRLAATAYVSPIAPPTVVQIRQEMDLNSIRLGAAATTIGVTMATNSVLSAIGTPLQATSYTPPPTAFSIAEATAGVMFVDGASNQLKVNSDHTVGVNLEGISIANYITVPPAIAISSQDPTTITCLRGDTLRVTLPSIGDVIHRTKLVVTAKANINDNDEQAVIQIDENIGLVRLNGNALVSPGWASLTVEDAATGIVNLVLDAGATASLVARDLVWDAQVYLPTGISSPISGTISVIADVTQAVV